MSNGEDEHDDDEQTPFDEWYQHNWEEPYEWNRRDEDPSTPDWESWLQHKDINFDYDTADGTHWHFIDDSRYDSISEANEAAKAIASDSDNIHSVTWHGGEIGSVRVV